MLLSCISLLKTFLFSERILKYKFLSQPQWSWLTWQDWEVPRASRCLLKDPLSVSWLQMLRSRSPHSIRFSSVFCLSIAPSPTTSTTSYKFILVSFKQSLPHLFEFSIPSISHTTKTIIEELWRLQQDVGAISWDWEPPSWSRFVLTILLGGIYNINHLWGISFRKGTSNRFNSLCSLSSLTFIPSPVAVYIHSTHLTALPEVQLPYFLLSLGSEAACPPQRMPILFLHILSHTSYQIQSLFSSHFC